MSSFPGTFSRTTLPTAIPTAIPSGLPEGGGEGGGNGGGNGGGGQPTNSSNTSLANSASLYLYTFLATLVLLLAVSGAIVIRSFILRRRHRRMIEEAIRNGTWVPPTAPTRPARVDLSKKPELWEAYLGDSGWQLGSIGHGSGKDLEKDWKFEHSRDWESIKPISASYAAPLPPYSSTPPNLTSLSPPVSIPDPTPINPSAARGDVEENQRNAELSTGNTPSLLSRAKVFLNPTPLFPSSTLPASSSADNGNISRSISTNVSMTELNSNPPTTVRVAVLIAMPSSPSHGSPTAHLSASLPSSLSSNAQSTFPHPPRSSPSSTVKATDDEELPLPHLEMGVAEVVVGRSEKSSTWNSAHSRREEKTTHSRGSSYTEP